MGDHLDRVEVAGPGFLNVFLTDAWYVDAAARVLSAGDDYGAGAPERPERVNVEFVSANPTGPLTAASGRHAAFGDSLARILEFAGHAVDREYYFNDSGTQVRKLGESIRARALGQAVPPDGYEGEYVAELAEAIPEAADLDVDVDLVARAGVERMFAQIRRTLEAYRVSFDVFFLENSLYEGDPTAVQRAYERLEARGHLYRHEGALWLRTNDFGDDKDRVLERSTGEPTYFASDVAYLEHKLERGYDRLVYVLGADHHGYMGRMRAAAAALGAEPERLELLILQFVHVVEGGQRASMSKRRGDFITLESSSGRSAWTRRASSCSAAPTTPRWTWTSTWLAVSPTRTPSTTCSTPTPASLPCWPRPGRRASRAPSPRARRGTTSRSAGRARAGQEAPGLPGEVDEAAERRAPAPHGRLFARARADLHGVLPGLPRGRGRTGGRRVLPDRAQRRRPAGDRPLARAARRPRA
jgi:hypothetical protein